MTIKPRPGAQRVSPALGAGKDPRARRSGTNEVEFPLVYEGGKLKLVISGISPLAVDPSRGLYERVADGVEVTSASPYATRVALGDGLMLSEGRIVPRFSKTVQINGKKQIVAVVSTSDVSDPTDGTAAAALGRVGNELAALDVRLDVLENNASLDSFVLTLTQSATPATGEGVEIIEAPGASAPVIRPKSNAGTADLDLRLFGLGTGRVAVDGGYVLHEAEFTAKGDVLVGTGAGTFAPVTVGANGTVPIADSSASAGVRWGACPEGGYQDFAHPGTSQYEAWFAANCATHTAFATQALVANRLYALPFVAAGRNGCALDRLGINITTGSAGNARLGIYNDSSGYPGSLLIDAGTVVTTNIAVVTATIAQALTPGGRYWYAYVSNATPTVRSIPVNSCSHALGFGSALGTAGNCGLYVAFAYAALPTPFPSTPTMITANPIPALFYRYSA